MDENEKQFDFFQITLINSYQVLSRIKSSSLLKYDWSQLEILTSITQMESNIDIQSQTQTHSQNKVIVTDEWKYLYTNKENIIPKSLFSPKMTEGSLYYNKSFKKWYIISLQLPITSINLF